MSEGLDVDRLIGFTMPTAKTADGRFLSRALSGKAGAYSEENGVEAVDMNICIAAEKSGIPPKTIRYYESIGLLPSVARAANGYRDYHDADVHTLRFVRHARRLGFTVPEVARLQALWRDRARMSAEVKIIAIEYLTEVDRKLHELEELKHMLDELVERCINDECSDYPCRKEFASRETN